MLDAVFGIYLFTALTIACWASWSFTSALFKRGLIRSEWEVRLLVSATVLGCLLVAVVEVTSLFHRISAPGLATAWVVATCGLMTARANLARRGTPTEAGGPEKISGVTSFNAEERLLFFISALAVVILFLLAVMTPPTSWDSFTYHLPRILNWIQNGSVAHFATHDTRQVESGPLAAFAVMQLYLVTQSDRLVNLVQWGAMVLSAVGVSWLAGEILIQAGRSQPGPAGNFTKSRVWAAFFAVTMPIGIVQSITTQTDYVIAFWVVCAAAFGFLLWRSPENSVYAALFGASLALGTITKATMAVTGGLLSACLLFFILRAAPSNRVRRRTAAIIGIVGMLIVAPHFTRNIRVFGSPLGSRYIYVLMRNQYQAPGIWISNFFRNLSLHAASGIGPLTSAVNKVLELGQSLSGLDANDRASTFHTSTFSYIKGYPMSDNSAGNFWHGLLALFGAIYLIVFAPNLRRWALLALGIAVATFALQNGYLRWTEWNARFHLPLFLLLAPIAGIALARAPTPARGLAALVLVTVGYHACLFNKSRPLLGSNEFLFEDRERQYFIEVPNLYRPVLNVANDVIASGSTNIGLRLYKNFFNYMDEMEYPFWAMLKNRGFNGKIYNVGVTNETAGLSNSVPIQTLISSTRGPRGEVAHLFPYVLTYPPIDVYWSETSGKWIQLTQIQRNDVERLLMENPNVIGLDENAAMVACRVARQGVLSLSAVIVKNDAPLQSPTALLATSFAGYGHASQSTNGQHAFEIPLPPGQTAVQFGVPGDRDPRLKLAIQWNWHPTEEPVPYVFISRIFEPTTSLSKTNSLTLLPGSLRVIHLVSGASGEVRLRLSANLTNQVLIQIEGKALATNAVIKGGVATIDVRVERGTNEFTIANQSAETVPLTRVDSLFR